MFSSSPKNEYSVIVYSPLCRSKPFFCDTFLVNFFIIIWKRAGRFFALYKSKKGPLRAAYIYVCQIPPVSVLLMMTLQRGYYIYYVHHGGWHPQESQCKWTPLTFSLSQTASDGLVSSLRSWQCVWMQAREWRHSLWHTSERSRSSEWDPPFNPIPKFSICWILTIKLGGVFHSLATVTDDSNRYFTSLSLDSF